MSDLMGERVRQMAEEVIPGHTPPLRYALLLSECARQLNHHLGKVEHAETVYEIVGALTTALERMPQALEELDAWLRSGVEAAELECLDDDISNVAPYASACLSEALKSIPNAARALRRAHSALARIREIPHDV